MKKPIIIILSVALAYSASAQFSKGTIFVGPTIGSNSLQWSSDNLNYDGSNNDVLRSGSAKTYNINIGPQLGVFLTNHIVLGASVNYSLTLRKGTTNTTLLNNLATNTRSRTYTNAVSSGPFLRYYFFNKLSKNLFYTQINAAVGTGFGNSTGSGNNISSSYVSDGKVNSTFTWNAGGGVGLTHFFNNFIGMDIALGYAYNSSKNQNTNNEHTTANVTKVLTSSTNNYKETVLTNGVNIGLGFHWFLHK